MQRMYRENRALIASMAALLLAGCSPALRDVPLAGLDLNDARTLASLKSGLPQRESVALTTYAMLHWPGSKFYCGNPIDKIGALPRTVGDAISQTIKFEADLEATRRSQAASNVASEFKSQQDQLLVDRFEQLTLERQMLLARGPMADPTKLETLDRELDGIRRKRAQGNVAQAPAS